MSPGAAASAQQADDDVTRLELDDQAERSVARLRLVAAALVGSSAIVILLFASPSSFGVVLALLGLGASLGWIVAFRRSGRRLTDKANYYLHLDAEGLTLAQGGPPKRIAWSEVKRATASEERLMLELELQDGGKLDIPPIFRGVGLYELEDLVNARLGAAPAPGDG